MFWEGISTLQQPFIKQLLICSNAIFYSKLIGKKSFYYYYIFFYFFMSHIILHNIKNETWFQQV